MAISGQRPKAALLKIVTGNPGHREFAPDPATGIVQSFDNGFAPPRKLRKRQGELWNLYIRRAPWLTSFDVPRAHMWVELHAEFEKAPNDMIPAKIAQLRALGSELGLDPASRARLGADQDRDDSKDPAAKYLS